MGAELKRQIDELGRLTTKQLKERFYELFGYETRSNHKMYLFRRIAWRLQALAAKSMRAGPCCPSATTTVASREGRWNGPH